ncbi:MAG: hypothetical protein AB1793_09825 [Candidatus Thermoplasmatota archaeon]
MDGLPTGGLYEMYAVGKGVLGTSALQGVSPGRSDLHLEVWSVYAACLDLTGQGGDPVLTNVGFQPFSFAYRFDGPSFLAVPAELPLQRGLADIPPVMPPPSGVFRTEFVFLGRHRLEEASDRICLAGS